MSLIRGIQANDSPSIDAFGRWRVSQPETLFDSKQIFDNQPLFWDDQEVSGSGTSSSHSSNTASSTLAVGATTAGLRVRQTFMRFNYQPGKSHLVLMTGVLDKSGGGTGITRGFGYGDDNNGLFLQDNEGTIQFVRRTYTSGSAVDNTVDQTNWNLDPMDGTGNSGITLDFTKTQILIIDFEWLGVGRARMGFVVDGLIFYCHEFLNANNPSVVYMSTPNLPARYWIENDGTGVASELDHICTSVISEGGIQENGIIRSANLGTNTVNANTIGTSYSLLGIRLKSTHLGATIKIINENLLATNNDDFLWELRLNPTVAGTFTYSDVTNSAVQVALADTSSNPGTNTVTGGSVIQSSYVTGNSSQVGRVLNAKYLGAAIDGTRDEMVLCVTPLTAGLNITGEITWRELN